MCIAACCTKGLHKFHMLLLYIVEYNTVKDLARLSCLFVFDYLLNTVPFMSAATI